MTNAPLSSSTRALLKAAKADAPSAATRAVIWKGVASSAQVGLAAKGGAGAIAGWSAGSGAAKVGSFAALFGGALTVGLATVLLHFAPVEAPALAPMPATLVAAATIATSEADSVATPV